MREVLGMEREWGVLAWDVAGKCICYMCLEAAGYLFLVRLSVRALGSRRDFFLAFLCCPWVVGRGSLCSQLLLLSLLLLLLLLLLLSGAFRMIVLYRPREH